MAQSKLRSLSETLTGTFTGMIGSWLITYGAVAVIANQASAVTVATLGCTIWSLARGYTIRRLFNKKDKSLTVPVVYNITGINEVAKKHWQWVDDMGWHNDIRVMEKLALVASEVGEAANECRGKQPTEAFGSELADIILRTIDIAYTEGIDIEKEIATKMAKNLANGTRGRIK